MHNTTCVGFSFSILSILYCFHVCMVSAIPVLMLFLPIQIRHCGNMQCGKQLMLGDFVVMLGVFSIRGSAYFLLASE